MTTFLVGLPFACQNLMPDILAKELAHDYLATSSYHGVCLRLLPLYICESKAKQPKRTRLFCGS